MAIVICVDSGSDLTPELAAQYGITVVPLTVHFGESFYRDGVDLTPQDFYQLLVTSNELPNTSQPSPGDFLQTYTEISQPGDVVFSFHLSSKFSGTYQSALLASRQLTDRDVRVIDTRSASLGIAIPAILASRLAQRGLSADQIESECRKVIQAQSVFFLVDTLEYLQRHGRIGKAQALVGSLLSIKPVLGIEDGVVAPVDKVRGEAKARARLIELALAKLTPGVRYMVGVPDAQVPEVAEEIVAALNRSGVPLEVFRATLGCTIGTHVGPGAVGVIIAPLPAE